MDKDQMASYDWLREGERNRGGWEVVGSGGGQRRSFWSLVSFNIIWALTLNHSDFRSWILEQRLHCK
ncbi:hypothetical protein L3X38_030529 [Prunus dulcis]|uniref:Uncharacterized protein n=1 Tax=Prunus dulcis TaxID=3755 RepID=A0AAD4YUS4_PRUDU|nr:hypothetical protein L3X38_030529 [Prunus dulcis]